MRLHRRDYLPKTLFCNLMHNMAHCKSRCCTISYKSILPITYFKLKIEPYAKHFLNLNVYVYEKSISTSWRGKTKVKALRHFKVETV